VGTQTGTRRLVSWPASIGALLLAVAVCGCSPSSTGMRDQPDVAPHAPPSDPTRLSLDAALVKPMYDQRLLPIDLPAVIQLVQADNIDIRLAKYQVERTRGRLESVVGSAFPAIVPGAIFNRIDGRNANSNGDLFNVGFNTFQVSVAIEWLINPGEVVYSILAARKRLEASMDDQEATRIETLRRAANQYYELVLAQAQIAATHQAVKEAEELLRINRIRAETGTGVPADELRAEARLAERRQDLALAMNAFYRASLDLGLTLQIEDATVTLVPNIDTLPPISLVRADIPIDDLLEIATVFRPDLAGARKLVEAAAAERGATWWSGFGPEFELGYEYGGITGNANNIDEADGIPGNLLVNPLSGGGTFSPNPVANGVIREGLQRTSRRVEGDRDITFNFGQRTEGTAGISTRWSLSTFGDLKAASAAQQQAMLEAKRSLLEVHTQVVRAAQDRSVQHELIDLARQQTAAADEALRLTQANLEAGTMTTLDVLQAQDAVAQARLRHAAAIIRYNQAEVNLIAALGLLDQAAIVDVLGTEPTTGPAVALRQLPDSVEGDTSSGA